MNLKYKTIANLIKENISNGKYAAGDKIPSENTLSIKYGVSRQTIRQAMSLLETENIIVRIQGSGTYVSKQAETSSPSFNIAVIATYIESYFFSNILKDIQDILYHAGYSPILFATHNRVDNERDILLELINKPIDGIIVEGTRTALFNPNIDLYREFITRKIPVVFFHSYYSALESPVYVIADDERGGMMICEYLIAKGHKNIAGIFKIDDMQGQNRFTGFAKALTAHNLPLKDENIMWFTTKDERPLNEKKILKTLEGCTAVVCYDDEIAVHVITALASAHLKVPDDISMISFDNSTYSEIASPKITSCALDSAQTMGTLVSTKMLNMLKGNLATPSTIKWRIIEKESVKDISGQNEIS